MEKTVKSKKDLRNPVYSKVDMWSKPINYILVTTGLSILGLAAANLTYKKGKEVGDKSEETYNNLKKAEEYLFYGAAVSIVLSSAAGVLDVFKTIKDMRS